MKGTRASGRLLIFSCFRFYWFAVRQLREGELIHILCFYIRELSLFRCNCLLLIRADGMSG